MHHSARSESPSALKLVLAFASVYLIWGSTYLAIKFCLETIPTVFLMPGVRFLAAGAALYAWSRRGAARPTLAQWRDAAVIGATLLYIANGSVVWAETRVSSGLTALIVAIVPLCMVLLDWLRPAGVRPGGITVAGLLLGLVGMAVLIGPSDLAGDERVDLLGAGGLVLACFVWSAGSLYSRRAARPGSAYLSAAMQMVAGGAMHLVTGTLVGEWDGVELAEISLKSAAALVYLIVFGSIVAFTAYMWLMQVATPARVATYAYVNPVVAVFLGWMWGDEALTARTFIATAVIVTAVVVITMQQAKRAPAVKAAPPDPARPPADAACDETPRADESAAGFVPPGGSSRIELKSPTASGDPSG